MFERMQKWPAARQHPFARENAIACRSSRLKPMGSRVPLPALCYLAAMMASAQTVPVQIAPGATVSITRHVPASSREIYTVTASAGQTLLVNQENSEGELQVLGAR